MKYYLFVLCFCYLGCKPTVQHKFSNFSESYFRKSAQPANALTSIEWKEPHKNLGLVKRGADIDIEFPFKNIGDSPLFVDSLFSGCSCTEVSAPMDSVLPGEESKIVARFYTKDQPAALTLKNVFVKLNTTVSPYHTLAFKVQLTD